MANQPDDNTTSERQDLLMSAVCTDDPAAAIAGIDAALAAGANFTDDDVEPLYSAAFNRQPDIVAHLLKRGATMAAEWPASNRTADRRDNVHGLTALHAAAEHGDTEILRLLLDADGRRFINTFGPVGETPLNNAAKAGHLEAVKLLISARADVNAQDVCHIGETALAGAVEAGHFPVVAWLLGAGADPTIRGWMALTPIHRAQMGGERLAPALDLIRRKLALPETQWKRLLLPRKK